MLQANVAYEHSNQAHDRHFRSISQLHPAHLCIQPAAGIMAAGHDGRQGLRRARRKLRLHPRRQRQQPVHVSAGIVQHGRWQWPQPPVRPLQRLVQHDAKVLRQQRLQASTLLR